MSSPPIINFAVITELHWRHRHVQVYEGEAGGGGLQPKSNDRPALLSGWKRKELHPTYSGHIQLSYIREDQNLKWLLLPLCLKEKPTCLYCNTSATFERLFCDFILICLHLWFYLNLFTFVMSRNDWNSPPGNMLELVALRWDVFA